MKRLKKLLLLILLCLILFKITESRRNAQAPMEQWPERDAQETTRVGPLSEEEKARWLGEGSKTPGADEEPGQIPHRLWPIWE